MLRPLIYILDFLSLTSIRKAIKNPWIFPIIILACIFLFLAVFINKDFRHLFYSALYYIRILFKASPGG